MKVINQIEMKEVRQSKMIKGSDAYYWNITVYTDDGVNYVLCDTTRTLLEAVKLAKDIESFPSNGEVKIVKETSLGDPCYRVYAPHYN